MKETLEEVWARAQLTVLRRPSTEDQSPVSDAERLAVVVGALRSGAAPAEAFETWDGVTVDAAGLPAWDEDTALTCAVRAASRLSRDAGVPLADVLDALARVQADLDQARARTDAALAGPRASARLLTLLPVIGAAFAAIIDPGVVRVLAATPLGWGILAVAAGLVAGARRWMRAMVRDAERQGSPL